MNQYLDIIPTPKKCTYTSGSRLCVGSVYVVGEENSVMQSALALLEKENIIRAACAVDADFVVYSDFTQIPQNSFDDSELRVFDEEYGFEQGYILKKTEKGKVIAAGKSPLGCAYAMVTLLQILGKEIGSFSICDFPDFRSRAIKWTVWAELGCWGYDYGDGVDALRKRLERKLENCFRYKINDIYADGYGFDTERFPEYANVMKYLCDQARKMGIRISSGGYSMSYGLADHRDAYQGKVYLNRKHYPDGEVYECLGRYLASKNTSTGRERGTCLSNRALFRQKMEEMTHFVKETHITGLSLHNMDSHEIHPQYWMARCEQCRKRWPNDSLYTRDGAAGAFAEFINEIIEQLCQVKEGDYDAATDLRVRMLAPGYSYATHTKDDVFDGDVDFWAAVSNYVKYPERFTAGFREQFFYHDKKEKRVDAMVNAFRGKSFSMANFTGCDGAYSDKLFVPSAALTYIMKGAPEITYHSGTVFHEPLAVYNAEYMWNSENSGFYNVDPRPSDYDSFIALYNTMVHGQYRPEQVYGDGGFLDVICKKLYGEDIGLSMAQVYKLCGENDESPVPCAAWRDIHTHYGSTAYPMSWNNILTAEQIDTYSKGFYQSHIMSVQAHEIMTGVVASMEESDLKTDLAVLRECFYMGAMLTKLLYEYMELYGKACAYLEKGTVCDAPLREAFLALTEQVAQMRNYVESNDAHPVDKFGGIFFNRKNMVEFLEENIAQMKWSVKSQKRIPDADAEVTIAEWDA